MLNTTLAPLRMDCTICATHPAALVAISVAEPGSAVSVRFSADLTQAGAFSLNRRMSV
jgi:hypothetical protein